MLSELRHAEPLRSPFIAYDFDCYSHRYSGCHLCHYPPQNTLELKFTRWVDRTHLRVTRS